MPEGIHSSLVQSLPSLVGKHFLLRMLWTVSVKGGGKADVDIGATSGTAGCWDSWESGSFTGSMASIGVTSLKLWKIQWGEQNKDGHSPVDIWQLKSKWNWENQWDASTTREREGTKLGHAAPSRKNIADSVAKAKACAKCLIQSQWSSLSHVPMLCPDPAWESVCRGQETLCKSLPFPFYKLLSCPIANTFAALLL